MFTWRWEYYCPFFTLLLLFLFALFLVMLHCDHHTFISHGQLDFFARLTLVIVPSFLVLVFLFGECSLSLTSSVILLTPTDQADTLCSRIKRSEQTFSSSFSNLTVVSLAVFTKYNELWYLLTTSSLTHSLTHAHIDTHIYSSFPIQLCYMLLTIDSSLSTKIFI